MKEQQKYLSILKEVDKQLELCSEMNDKQTKKELLAILEELFEEKPVRLNYFLTKIKATQDLNCQGIMTFLKNKYELFYDYPGIIELLELTASYGMQNGDYAEAARSILWRCRVDSDLENQDSLMEFAKTSYMELSERKKLFLEDTGNSEHLVNLAETYYKFNNTILYYFLTAELERRKVEYPHRDWMREYQNVDLLKETLLESQDVPFILICGPEMDRQECEILLYILAQFKKSAFLIDQPFAIEIEKEVELRDTVEISMQNLQKKEKQIIIPSVELIKGEESVGNNQEYILEELLKDILAQQFAIVLSSGEYMETLCQTDALLKRMRRLYTPLVSSLEKEMTFGQIGDYLTYISFIHKMDARQLLEDDSECEYSIIVPARNSSETLRYTLMTCLEQRYAGSYEIILSDNSTSGNDAVHQLYQELKHPRIKYYKTPREYGLTKSFEFAVLHAKGEFILTLGSDDGLLPWALDMLDKVRKDYPNEEILAWDRGFYAWPGFNGGQQNQFVIPRRYEKNMTNCYYLTKEQQLSRILSNRQSMYGLPNLYINSGCTKKYLRKILDKTGELYEGICQDIQMGVLNMCLNSEILYLKYPLAIAGMSGNSIGALSSSAIHKELKEENQKITAMYQTVHIGEYTPLMHERLLPRLSYDDITLYRSVLRAISLKLLPEQLLDIIDWKQLFLQLTQQFNRQDIQYDMKLHYCRYTAAYQGEEFLQWFDQSIYESALQPILFDEILLKKLDTLDKKKKYEEKPMDDNGLVCDASDYGVTNIYEAVKLFEKISGL